MRVWADYGQHEGRNWVHYSTFPDLKIHPRPRHADPAGIYLFPESFEPSGHWRFMPYRFIVQVPPTLRLLDFAHLDSAALVPLKEALVQHAGRPDVVQDVQNADQLWERLVGYFSGKPGAFNAFLRKLGYDAVFDDTGSIHGAEEQLLVLDPTKVKVLKREDQKASGFQEVQDVAEKVAEHLAPHGTVTLDSTRNRKDYWGSGRQLNARVKLVLPNGHYADFNITPRFFEKSLKGRVYRVSVFLQHDSGSLKSQRSRGGEIDPSFKNQEGWVALRSELDSIVKELESKERREARGGTDALYDGHPMDNPDQNIANPTMQPDPAGFVAPAEMREGVKVISAAGLSIVTIPPGYYLFHGTLEPFSGSLRPGGYDKLAWFSDSPKVAQLYIPKSGGELYTSAQQIARPTKDETIREIQQSIGIDYDYTQVEWDDRTGRPSSWRHPESWDHSPTEEEVKKLLDRAGYEEARHGGYRFRTNLGKVLKPGEVLDGRLFIGRTLQPLRLWLKSEGEGDLQNVQYHDLEGFENAGQQGLDGVLIDDFAQSEEWGNLGHLSVGLNAEALKKLSIESVPARYREWEQSARGTPEYPNPPPMYLHKLPSEEAIEAAMPQPTTLYHGSPIRFSRFLPPNGGVDYGVGIYFTEHVKASLPAEARLAFEATPQDPYTTVYRLQDSAGRGPYQEAIRWGGDQHGGGCESWEEREQHPMPGEDRGFSPEELKELTRQRKGNTNPLRFGFLNRQQYENWFTKEEKEKLTELGYRLVEIKAQKVWDSGKQIFFLPLGVETAAASFEDEGWVGKHWGSQASGILFRTDDALLLLKRASWVDRPNTWGIPGGAVPVSPSGPMDPKASAFKEVEEEIGGIPPHRDTGLEMQYRDGEFRYTTYVVEVDHEFSPILNNEHTDFQWIGLDSALKLPDLHPGVRWMLGGLGWQNGIVEAAVGAKRRAKKQTMNAKEMRDHLLDTLHPEETDGERQEELADRITVKYPNWELKKIPIRELLGYNRYFASWPEIKAKVKEYEALPGKAPAIVAIPLDHEKYKDSSTRVHKWDVVDGKHRLLVAKRRGETILDVWVPAGPSVQSSVSAQWKAEVPVLLTSNGYEKDFKVVYHGSDFLPKGQKPKGDGRNAGAYYADSVEFAKEFGRTIHEFSLDLSKILDMRKPEHRQQVQEAFGDSVVQKLTQTPLGLPPASNAETLDLILEVISRLKFCGAVEDENFHNHVSYEVYDPSCVKPLRQFDWTKSNRAESMAPPSRALKAKRYFHGTKKASNAAKIWQEGILPDLSPTPMGEVSRPVAGRVYMADNLYAALPYLLGGHYIGYEAPSEFIKQDGRYGYLFVLDGRDLQDVHPDEDQVGQALHDNKLPWMRKKFEKMLRQEPPLAEGEEPPFADSLWQQVTEGEYAAFIKAGHVILPLLSDQEKLAIIRLYGNVAHEGALRPVEMWKFDKKDSISLTKDGSNFFELAEKVKTRARKIKSSVSSELDVFFDSAGSYEEWYEEQRKESIELLARESDWASKPQHDQESEIAEWIQNWEESEPSTMIFFREPRWLKRPWLVRFTDQDPVQFARKAERGNLEGGDPEHLGLTFHITPPPGQLAFAFSLPEAPPGGHGEYGLNAILLQVPEAVEAQHISDGEKQTVFDVDTVEMAIPLLSRNGYWHALDHKSRNVVAREKIRPGCFERLIDKIFQKPTQPRTEPDTAGDQL